MTVYEKCIWKYKYIRNTFVNSAQLYFTVGRSDLHENFSSIPKDGSDIHRFSNREWVSTRCTVGIL